MTRNTDKPPFEMPTGSIVDVALIASGLTAMLCGLVWLLLI